MSNKHIYNKLPEGYVPVPKVDRSKEIQLFKQGSITEITMGGKTFQIQDAMRVEQTINFVERHEERLFTLNQEMSQLKRKIQELNMTVQRLQNTVNQLQEQIKNAGFNRF